MNASPTSTARAPAATMRAHVGRRVDAALGDERARPAGTSGASRSVVSSVVTNVRRSRLLMPTSVAPAASAHSSSRCVVHLDQRVEPELARRRQQLAAQRRVAGGDDQQHRVGAPGARLVDLVRVDEEVLAQAAAAPTAARTAARCSRRPGRSARSVSTESAAAPAAA